MGTAADHGSGRGLRSADWFGEPGRMGAIYRSWVRGYPPEVFDGRPVIGIANSWSELTPCNAHLRRVADAVKQGVWQAGGFPLEFPTTSIGETLMRPTAMLFRNLMSMDVEETLRANPVDGVVLLSGCDKTTPAMLMGAASVDLPAIMVTGGPMLSGKFQGRDVGSGTDIWRFSEEVRAGRMSPEDFRAAESCMARSDGHCMTMGTASTMACMAEALGMQLPGAAAIPASDSRRYTVAMATGQRIVAMVAEDLRPSRILTRAAFENAVRVNAAIGGSSNAAIHLIALAGRVGVPLGLDDFDALARAVPTSPLRQDTSLERRMSEWKTGSEGTGASSLRSSSATRWTWSAPPAGRSPRSRWTGLVVRLCGCGLGVVALGGVGGAGRWTGMLARPRSAGEVVGGGRAVRSCTGCSAAGPARG